MLGRRQFMKGVGATAGAMAARPLDALSDVPRTASWKDGLEKLFSDGLKGMERGDTFVQFENNEGRWTDSTAPTRMWDAILMKVDWDRFEDDTKTLGEAKNSVTVHTHPPMTFERYLGRGRTSGYEAEKLQKYVVAPPSLGDIINFNSDVGRAVHTPRKISANFKSVGLTLDTRTKDGWLMTPMSREALTSKFPALANVDSIAGTPEFLEKVAEDRFHLLLLDF